MHHRGCQTKHVPRVIHHAYEDGDIAPKYLIDIGNLEHTKLPTGYRQDDSDEMFLFYNANDTLYGKIEFSKNGGKLDWILTMPGHGTSCLKYFEQHVLHNRGINSIILTCVVSPDESPDTVLTRMNFYQKNGYRFTHVTYNDRDVIFTREKILK